MPSIFTKKKFMKNILLLFAVVFGATAIAQSYTDAESVEWDVANNRWLVANGSNIIIDDGNGGLSFFGNASASHGMEVIGDVLFVLDSNVIKGYLLEDATEVMSLSIPGVAFLNGMGSDKANEILYISDFGDDKVFSVDVSDLNNPTFIEIVSNTGGTPNGVLYDEGSEDRLLFVTWGNNAKIKAIDLTDFSVSDVVSDTGVGNIDGIVRQSSFGDYYISSWSPARIVRYDSEFNFIENLITSGISAPADIGMNNDFFQIAIPVGNDVVFADVPWEVGVEEFNLTEIGFKLSGNPIQQNSYIEFNIENTAQMSIALFNVEGKKVASILGSGQVSGFNKVALPYADFSSGTYFLHVTMNNKKQIIKLLVK
ncbi:MAG: hypothetical protein ACI9KI_001245 [Patiriisocius sp.]|jgi:hypothetical protein